MIKPLDAGGLGIVIAYATVVLSFLVLPHPRLCRAPPDTAGQTVNTSRCLVTRCDSV